MYRLQVINYRDAPIKCKINFKITEGLNPSDVNLFFPVGGFKAVVQAKDTKTILLLHKLRTNTDDNDNNEINKLITEFYFTEKYPRNTKPSPSTGGNDTIPGY